MADKPASRTGLRRGPIGFVRDLFSDEPARVPLPPPPGMGETLATVTVTRKQHRRTQLQLLLIILVLVGAVGLRSWPWDKGDWLFHLGISLLGWWMINVGNPPTALSVGENWLRTYPPRADPDQPAWVRTDQLVRIDQHMLTFYPMLKLTDRDGRTITIDPSDLKTNRTAWRAFRRAAQASYQQGLEKPPTRWVKRTLRLRN